MQTVEEIVSEKVIACEELVCQLQPSLLRSELVFCASRDGNLRMLNIASGLVEKNYSVSSNSLIELVAIEREMNVDSPLLITCSAKDSALIVTKMDSGVSSLLKLPSNLGIDFGCGIGPKIVVSDHRDGLVAVVNQKPNSREFSLYELELK